MALELDQPKLPALCARCAFNTAKVAVAEWCSPKSFRLETGLAWLAVQASQGDANKSYFWIGPDFSSCSVAMTTLKSALTEGTYTIPARSTSVILINGATIRFCNAEYASALYSDSCYAVVVDQAINVPDKSWRIIQETLANTRASARIISTVGAQDNWFNEIARRAESEQSESLAQYKFTALDAVVEGILTQADLDYARSSLPDHMYRALYLCLPYDTRVEAAYRAREPKLMSDEELAIIAHLDPTNLDSVSDAYLSELSAAQ